MFHLFYNNTEQKCLSQPTTNENPEVPEKPILVTHHSQRNHQMSPKIKNHVYATVTTISIEGQKVCHHQKASQEGCNVGDKVLHYSSTQPCQTTSHCLPKNFLPYWSDSRQIMDDPLSKAKMQKVNRNSTGNKHGSNLQEKWGSTQTETDLTLPYPSLNKHVLPTGRN